MNLGFLKILVWVQKNKKEKKMKYLEYLAVIIIYYYTIVAIF